MILWTWYMLCNSVKNKMRNKQYILLIIFCLRWIKSNSLFILCMMDVSGIMERCTGFTLALFLPCKLSPVMQIYYPFIMSQVVRQKSSVEMKLIHQQQCSWKNIVIKISGWALRHGTTRNVNSLRSSDAYMCPWNIPTLLQIMACRLFGAKPLSEPMLPYCQLDPKEHISVKFYLKCDSFHERKYTQWNGGHFVLPSMC